MSNLPPLPEPGLASYSLDSAMRKYEHQSYTAEQLRAFAEEAVRLERERCIAAIEAVEEPAYHGYECPNTFNDGKWAAAAAIRARSKG